MAKALLALLFLAVAVSCFDETYFAQQFLDQQPHNKLRIDFDFQGLQVSDIASPARLYFAILADLGYYFDYYEYSTNGYTFPAYVNRGEGLDPVNDRWVSIDLVSVTGENDINFGTFFDGNPNNNYVTQFSRQMIVSRPSVGQAYYVDGTYIPGDIAYYNAAMKFEIILNDDDFQRILTEGFCSIVFTFSDAVNSFYKYYPRSDMFRVDLYGYPPRYYNLENFVSVRFQFDEAVVAGDPHFFGWNGAQFDFQGETHKVYNLLSHREVNVNFQMKQRSFLSVTSFEEMDRLKHNTYLGTIAVSTKNHKLSLYAGDSGFQDSGYIVLDGKKYSIMTEKKTIFKDEELELFWQYVTNPLFNHRDPIVGILVINAGPFRLSCYFIEEGRNPDNKELWSSHPFRYFDITASKYESEHAKLNVHGLLGQTGDEFLQHKLTGHEFWTIEGEFEDYSVSDLFSHDFKFNLFHH